MKREVTHSLAMLSAYFFVLLYIKAIGFAAVDFSEARRQTVMGDILDNQIAVELELKASSMRSDARNVYNIKAQNGRFLQDVKVFPGVNQITARSATGQHETLIKLNLEAPRLRVQLDWAGNDQDYDLHVNEVYYGNQKSGGGTLDHDWIDNESEGNPLEITTYPAAAEGLYRIYVNYFSNHNNFSPQITTVRIYVNDELVHTDSYLITRANCSLDGNGESVWNVGTVVLHSGDQVGGYAVDGKRLDVTGQGVLKGVSPRTSYSVTELTGPNGRAPVYLAIGEAAQFTAVGTLNTGSGNAQSSREIIERFTSSDVGVGSVDALGVFVATAPGHTQISVEGYSGAPVDVYVLKVEMAMDGNRDDFIDFEDPADKKYLFWVNNDHDERHYLQTELTWVEDDLDGEPDWNNNYIGFKSGIGSSCKRDLEDFTRLHFRVDETITSLPDVTYYLIMENSNDALSINVFEAVVESTAYLSQVPVADDQINKDRVLMVDATERQLPSKYIKTGNLRSCFILEGNHSGTGDLTLIVKNSGKEICRKSVHLELHDMTWFYNVYSVGVMSGDRWETQISTTVVTSQTALYKPATDEKFLLVHGWNMTDKEKKQWAETTFKRLWWQGYQGTVASFNWPTLAEIDFWDVVSGFHHFDNSEFRSWLSADALLGVFNILNVGGKLRVMAHSMGNVVVGETIKRYSGVKLHSYLACQAALSGQYYDNKLSSVLVSPDTPNIIGHFRDAVDDAAYLVGNAAKVTKQVNYYNRLDWALAKWELNNAWKPDGLTPYLFGYSGSMTSYKEGVSSFNRGPMGNPIQVFKVSVSRECFTIFSYIAESRSLALGEASNAQFIPVNLQLTMQYDGTHYSHSKEFRSSIPEQWNFWKQALLDCDFVPTYDQK